MTSVSSNKDPYYIVIQRATPGSKAPVQCGMPVGGVYTPCPCNASSSNYYTVTFRCYDKSFLCPKLSSKSRRLSSEYDHLWKDENNYDENSIDALEDLAEDELEFHHDVDAEIAAIEYLLSTGGRRLQDEAAASDDEEQTSDALEGQKTQTMVNTMGLVSAIGSAFADTLSVNPFLVDPNKAKYTIAFVCVLAFILLSGACYFTYKQKEDDDKFEALYKRRHLRKLELHASLRQANEDGDGLQLVALEESSRVTEDNIALAEDEEDDSDDTMNPVQVIRDTLPSNLAYERPTLTWGDYINCQIKSHDYINIFSFRSRRQPRFTRFMCIYAGFMVQVLWETIFLQVLVPEGKCEPFTDKASCNAVPNAVAPGALQCKWTKADGGKCSAADPPGDIAFTAMISCAIIIFSIPLQLFIAFLFEEILCYVPDWDSYFVSRKFQPIEEESDFVIPKKHEEEVSGMFMCDKSTEEETEVNVMYQYECIVVDECI